MRKKLFAILMSAMMMVTFMPTMAFAGTYTGLVDNHDWNSVADSKLSTAATCTAKGVDVFTCKGNGELKCDAVKYERTSASCDTQKIQMTVEEYADKAFTTAEEKAAYLKDNAAYCYGYAYECKKCGKLDTITGLIEKDIHKALGTPNPCSKTYTCKYCKKEIEKTPVHTEGAWVVAAEQTCGGKVWTKSCTLCGEVLDYKWDNTGDVVGAHNWGTALTAAEVTAATTAGTLDNYVEIEGKYYAPNVVLTKATCTVAGKGCVQCKSCGMIANIGGAASGKTYTEQLEEAKTRTAANAAIPALGHEYETIETPATCTERGSKIDLCKVCKATRNKIYTDAATGHDYEIKVIWKPTCVQAGLIEVTCKNANCDFCETAADLLTGGQIVDTRVKATDPHAYKFKGVAGSTLKEAEWMPVEDWGILTEDYGKYEDMQAATCETGVIQAKKCATCGHFNVHTAKEVGTALGHKVETTVVAPTCSRNGYSYNTCSVCGVRLNEKGETAASSNYTFNPVKMLVGPTAKCNSDVTKIYKKATVYTQGLEVGACSICGDEQWDTQVVIPKKSLTVKAGKKKVTVTVPALAGATKYDVKVGSKTKTVTKAGKVTVKKLKSGKKVKVTVAAYTPAGKFTSKAKTVKVK